MLSLAKRRKKIKLNFIIIKYKIVNNSTKTDSPQQIVKITVII